jgi:hypothetical protein
MARTAVRVVRKGRHACRPFVQIGAPTLNLDGNPPDIRGVNPILKRANPARAGDAKLEVSHRAR